MGSRGNNVLRSPGGANTFVSYSGNDQLIAGNGKDRFEIYMNLNSAINTFKKLNSADYENKVVTVDLTKSKGAKIKLYGIDEKTIAFRRVRNALEVYRRTDAPTKEGQPFRKVLIKGYFNKDFKPDVKFVFPSETYDKNEKSLMDAELRLDKEREGLSKVKSELASLNLKLKKAEENNYVKTEIERYNALKRDHAVNPFDFDFDVVGKVRRALHQRLEHHGVNVDDVDNREKARAAIKASSNNISQLKEQISDLKDAMFNEYKDKIKFVEKRINGNNSIETGVKEKLINNIDSISAKRNNEREIEFETKLSEFGFTKEGYNKSKVDYQTHIRSKDERIGIISRKLKSAESGPNKNYRMIDALKETLRGLNEKRRGQLKRIDLTEERADQLKRLVKLESRLSKDQADASLVDELFERDIKKEPINEKLVGRDQEGDVANTSRVNNLQLVQAMNSMGGGEKTGLDNKLSQSDNTLIKVKPILSHRY